MSLTLTAPDTIFVPDDVLARSFVGVHGITAVPDLDADDVSADDDDLWDTLTDQVTVTSDDGELSNYRVLGEAHEVDDAPSETGVVIEWQAALSFPHTQQWSVDRIESEAADRISVDQGAVRGASYGHSRPAYEYPTEDWQRVDTSGADTVIEQWFHSSLLLIIGLIEVELDDGDPAYAIAELAPPVPSPYEVGRYRAYHDREVATLEMKQYMTSISGAVEQEVADPVATAHEQYSFTGTEIDGPDISQSQLQASRGDLDISPMKSLPNRPLTDDEVETLVESFEQLYGECTLLLPEDPRYVDGIVRRAQYVTAGEHVSFTITTPDGFTIFELEEREKGLRWFRKDGELTVP